MIKAANIVSDFISRIKADDYFGDITVTRAFPNVIKPTLLGKAAVAAGIKEINIEETSLGQNVKAGSTSIFADIYVPFSFEKERLEEIAFRICACTADMNIVSIEISEISVNKAAACYTMRVVFTFSGGLEF